ncbi:MAG: ParA family protein [Gammaproteobacteria bacterium]
MKVFAVINQKGGTGKTTVSLNLSSRLAELKQRVLLIDADPQGNATSGSGVEKWRIAGGVYEVLDGAPARDKLIYSLSGGYWLLAANMHLAGAEMELAGEKNWQRRLRDALPPLRDSFDFALIDCPPSLGALTVNALVAAEHVLIPMQCEYFAMEGLSDLAATVRRLRAGWNPSLSVAGIVRSMLDRRNLLARGISEELVKHFGDKVFASAIGRNVRIAEAPSHGLPVLRYAPRSPGAEGYRQLGDEFLARFA